MSARLVTGAVPEPEALEESPVPGRLVLQVASYRTRRRAQEVLVQIRAATGLAGAVLPSDVNGERWYRILLGPFPDETEAARAASPLHATGLVGEILIRPVPPGWDAALRPEGW
jgi:cell division protein FtsN